jgi:hypothetical protein
MSLMRLSAPGVFGWIRKGFDNLTGHCQLKQGWYPPAVGGTAVRCREVLGTPIGLPPLKRKGQEGRPTELR